METHRHEVPPLPPVSEVDPADRAMGLELEANELEDELEWAEAQGREGDATLLRSRLESVVTEWGLAAEEAAARRAPAESI